MRVLEEATENGAERRGDRKVLLQSLLIFLALFIFSTTIAISYPFYSRGEAREGLVVKDMIEQQNLILPLRNGVAIPSKPPLFHWLAMFSYRTLDLPPEFAMRLPSVLASSLTAALLYIFAATRYGLSTALITVLLLGSSLEWARSATLARVDMVFSASLFASFLVLVRFLERRTEWEHRTEWLLGALLLGGFLACAVLAKGPVGLAIPLLSLGVAWLYLYRGLQTFPFRSMLLAVIICCAVSGAWYYTAYTLHREDFLEVHLMRENIARILRTSDTEEYLIGHSRPFYFSFLQLLQGFLPWSVFIFVPLVAAFQNRQRCQKLTDPGLALSVIWFLTVLVIFSISRSKRPVYLLPLYPCAALLFARALTNLDSEAIYSQLNHVRMDRARTLVSHGVIFLVALTTSIAAASLVLAYVGVHVLPTNLQTTPFFAGMVPLLPTLSSSTLLLVIVPISLLWVAIRFNTLALRQIFLALSLSMFVAIGIVGTKLLPIIAERNSPSVFMSYIQATLPDGAKLFQYKHDFFPALFYLKHDLGDPIKEAMISQLEVDLDNVYLLVQDPDWPGLREQIPRSELLLASEGNVNEGNARLLLVYVGPSASAERESRSTMRKL